MPRSQPERRWPPRATLALAALIVAPLAVIEVPPLKSLAPSSLHVGAALNQAQVDGRDAAATAIVVQHFNSITPENLLKWEAVHPDPDRYDFEAADRFVAFGRAHDMQIVGHTLVWHQQTPAWVFGGASGRTGDRATVLGRMRAHIMAVVGRYRGRVHAWDVVNEALEEDGTLRRTAWRDAIGDDYIARAFEFAREADPQAQLIYNDYNLWKPAKRDGAIALVNRLRQQGIRVDGIGEQAHWGLSDPPIAQIDAAIGALASGAGVRIALTELDVDVLPREPDQWGADLSRKAQIRATTNIYPNGLPDAQQQQLARRYAEIFETVLRHRERVSRVTFWGVTDAQSWLHDFPIPGRINYPLLWDHHARPKPALDAVAAVLGTKR
jgi:endo-1,4-beta-xylanase